VVRILDPLADGQQIANWSRALTASPATPVQRARSCVNGHWEKSGRMARARHDFARFRSLLGQDLAGKVLPHWPPSATHGHNRMPTEPRCDILDLVESLGWWISPGAVLIPGS
jgi:hypothetical protein